MYFHESEARRTSENTPRTSIYVCSNWNALVAAAETKNKLLLRMKTALFTN